MAHLRISRMGDVRQLVGRVAIGQRFCAPGKVAYDPADGDEGQQRGAGFKEAHERLSPCGYGVFAP